MNAIDLAPIHVASWLLRNNPDPRSALLAQIKVLRRESSRGLFLSCEAFNSTWSQAEFRWFLTSLEQVVEAADSLLRIADPSNN